MFFYEYILPILIICLFARTRLKKESLKVLGNFYPLFSMITIFRMFTFDDHVQT